MNKVLGSLDGEMIRTVKLETYYNYLNKNNKKLRLMIYIQLVSHIYIYFVLDMLNCGHIFKIGHVSKSYIGQ